MGISRVSLSSSWRISSSAEHRAQVVVAHGLAGAGVQQRRGFIFHVGPDIVPGARQFLFGQVDLVGDFLGAHTEGSFLCAARDKTKRPLSHRACVKYPLGQKPESFCGATQIGESLRPLIRRANTHRSPLTGEIRRLLLGHWPVRSALGSPFGKGGHRRAPTCPRLSGGFRSLPTLLRPRFIASAVLTR